MAYSFTQEVEEYFEECKRDLKLDAVKVFLLPRSHNYFDDVGFCTFRENRHMISLFPEMEVLAHTSIFRVKYQTISLIVQETQAHDAYWNSNLWC